MAARPICSGNFWAMPCGRIQVLKQGEVRKTHIILRSGRPRPEVEENPKFRGWRHSPYMLGWPSENTVSQLVSDTPPLKRRESISTLQILRVWAYQMEVRTDCYAEHSVCLPNHRQSIFHCCVVWLKASHNTSCCECRWRNECSTWRRPVVVDLISPCVTARSWPIHQGYNTSPTLLLGQPQHPCQNGFGQHGSHLPTLDTFRLR